MVDTPQETLRKLNEAIGDAKAAKREVNEARAALADVFKQNRARIEKQIDEAVSAAVADIRMAAEQAMRDAVATVIDELRRDWRAKLNL